MRADATAILLGLPGLREMVGTRVVWGGPDPDRMALPYLALTCLDGQRGYSLEGGTGLREDILQIDAWADTASVANAVSEAVASEMNGWRGQHGATFFRSVRVIGGRDLYGRGTGTQTPLYGRSIDLGIRWRTA
ncbi:DUF3168 domain-containing protein [Mangrovicoccus sp. HB161399]|uniref:tail completion protein gp17 n=1 Tax=Mangrovicoccus sp. HB161399 TaxID=2720392 RepID=UPI00155571E7|nr:DUF3168 domain-containing protein [Mangrovicoccus sp. HB161399]